MENASKALIMAGGVMLVILILALVMFAWSRFSKFYSSQDEIRYIEDKAKFNEQFSAYDRKGISGFDLVSLANRIADYNFRFSNSSDAKNDKQGNIIHLTINLVSKEYRNKFVYDDTVAKNNNYRLFLSNKITTTAIDGNNSKNLIGYILKEVANIESMYGSPEEAAKVAKDLTNIEKNRAALNYYSKTYGELSAAEQTNVRNLCVQNLKKLTGNAEIKTYNDVESYIGANGEKIYKYWEYYQFKRGIYDCTDFQYDDQGRVSAMTFKFTGKIR